MRALEWFQSPGPIILPSVYVINGVRIKRPPLKPGPKPKGGRHAR